MRYEPAVEETLNILREVIDNKFASLTQAVITVLMDTKKRKSGGNLVLAKLQKTNEVQRYLTMDDDNPDGVDYFLFIDKLIFTNVEDEDKKRILYKALLHADVNFEKTIPYGIKSLTNDDFHREQEASGDPQWEARVLTIGESLYDEES